MEHIVRVVNEEDRQTLSWLLAHVGESRVADAARHLMAQRQQNAGTNAKPYVSAICRYLGVWPPATRRPTHTTDDHTVGDQYLAQMRQLLAQRTSGSRRAA